MPRKKKSKSDSIREYLASNPDTPVAEISKTLKVTPALVYRVKNADKPKNGSSRRNGTSRVKRAGAATNGKDYSTIIEAARLIQHCGGAESARAAIAAAEEVVAAVE